MYYTLHKISFFILKLIWINDIDKFEKTELTKKIYKKHLVMIGTIG